MLKKSLAIILLVFIVFSQLQLGTIHVYAKESLLYTQETHIQELENLDIQMTQQSKKMEKKIKNKKKKEKLKQKQKEAKQVLKEAKKKIKKEKNIQGDLKKNKKKKKKALKILKKSLKDKDDYGVVISSQLNKKQIVKTYKQFDKKVKVKKLYNKGNKTYFLLTFSKDSLLQQELFTNIESGELPEKFNDIEVIPPEIFSINSTDLSGENISQTWGVQQYGTYNYFDKIDSSQKIKVAVIDTGIQTDHPDLQKNIVAGYDFVNNDADAGDDQGHGTHVAGTIAADINGSGIIGVNPHVELIPLKICDQDGLCPSYAITRAISYAQEHNIDIINMSLGGIANPNGHAICDGISHYVQNGGIAVAAAGNNNIDATKVVPGGCSDVISVGAIDKNNQKASFSNYGESVDIMAPGVNIYSTSLNNSYKELSGTSMAAPHVTGLVSLLKQSGLGNDTIITQLKRYTDGNKTLNTQGLFEDVIHSSGPGENDTKIPSTGGNENKDEATINPNIVFIENQEELDKQKFEYPEVEEPILTNSSFANQIIDFGNDNIVTNNAGEEKEFIDISETIEGEKEFFIPGDKYFNTHGEVSVDEFGINSTKKGNPIKSYKVNKDFDYKNFNFSEYDFSYIKQEDLDIYDTEENKIQTYSIDADVTYTSDIHNFDLPIIHSDDTYLDGFTDDKNEKQPDDIVKINSTLECQIYVDGMCEFRLWKGRRYDRSESSPGIVSLSHSKRVVYITGKKIGTTQLTYTRDNGEIELDVLITVKPKPDPITYDYRVTAGTDLRIEFPESISKMDLERIGNRIYDDLEKENNYLSIETYTVGEQTFKLTDKRRDLRYIINVVTYPIVNTYNIHITDDIETRYNSNYNREELNRDIVDFYRKSGDGFIKGLKEGKAKIEFYRDGGLRRIFDITVSSIPEPTEIICNVVVGDWCKFNIKNGGHTYSESKNNVIDMQDRQNTVGLKALSSGQATVYVKSPYGNYFTHILKINVSAEPPVVKTCEIPQGLSCETKRYNRSNNYTFAVSQQGMVDLQLIRYWKKEMIDGKEVDVKTNEETLHIKGLQEGSVDVYVYKNGDHITTFQTTILPAITSLVIQDKLIKLKQTHNYASQVTGGGGEYMVIGEDPNIAYVDVDKVTGKLQVSAKNPGRYYPIITDKYNQQESVEVVVEDIQLILDTYEAELKVGERQYVHIYESYYGVQLEKTNENIRAYKTTFTNGDKAITIVGEQPGNTILKVTDGEGNIRTVNVTITGSSNTDPGTGNGGGDTDFTKDIYDFIFNFLLSFGFKITETISINNGNYYTCNLNNSKKTYIRPHNAECVTDQYHAWKCKTGFIELDGFTCVDPIYLEKRNIYLEQEELSKTKVDIITGTYDFLYKDNHILDKFVNTSNLLKEIRKNQINFNYINKENKELSSFVNLIIDYQVQKLYNIYQQHEIEFNRYKAEIETRKISLAYTDSFLDPTIAKNLGQIDGHRQAINDELGEYANLLNYEDFGLLLQGLWNFVTNLDEEVENIKNSLGDLYVIYQNRHEIFAELNEYNKNYYLSYIETTIQIALVPIKIGKLNKVKQPKDSQSITEMRELKDKWCNYGEITTNSYIEVASSNCKRVEDRENPNAILPKNIDKAIDLILNDPNKIIHIFQPKHNLDPLVTRLGGKRQFLYVVLNNANGKFPTSGVFEKTNPVITNIDGYTVYIQGRIIDGVPRVGTMYIP